MKWEEATNAVILALEARNNLWNAVLAALDNTTDMTKATDDIIKKAGDTNSIEKAVKTKKIEVLQRNV